MTVSNSFKRSDLLNLADAINSRVSSPFGFGINAANWSSENRAFLNLSHDKVVTGIEAHCIISVYHDWVMFMPDVKCRECWVKREIDWHVGRDGSLCYDLDLRWRDKVGYVMKSEGTRAAVNFAAEWCLHHSRFLLWRHYYAYTNNIEKWPADWPAWGHGEKGRNEYRSSQLLKQMN